MPLLPLILHQKIVTDVDAPENSHDIEEVDGGHGISNEAAEVQQTKVRNRRKRYLDANPDYLGPSLELADPLLYDRLIRRFQSAAEREAEGRAKGYSGVLEADLLRSEAKIEALAHPDPRLPLQYSRGPNGEIIADDGDAPESKAEGKKQWRRMMELRFLDGNDLDFDYTEVDDNQDWDDKVQERRDAEEAYFGEEEPSWVLDEDKRQLKGETGVQDF